MTRRAVWKGWLKVAELSCAVALHAAVTESERIAFHNVNRRTGARLRREFVDSETGEPVAREDQVKGYEVAAGEYLQFAPEELADAIPESDKTLAVSVFVPCDEIDTLYLEKPYFLSPTDQAGEEVFALIREGLREEGAAALAQTVLFRRVRNLLIRPEGAGMIASTLAYDYEVRPAGEVFADLPEIGISDEMRDLAKRIIAGKAGAFDPAAFDDRYEAALADLVQARIEGRRIPRRRPPREGKVVDLLEALRASAAEAKPRQGGDGPRGPGRKAG